MLKFVVWSLLALNSMVRSLFFASLLLIFKGFHLDIQLLTEAFNKLKQNFQVNLVQSKDSIGQDIYILLAEAALDVRSSLYRSIPREGCDSCFIGFI